MSAASGPSSSAVPLKKFVSQTEIEEKRRKRQEEWEKVRQPNQPLEAPEEPVESRSLYEQLQAQKDLKQLEFEEQHKLKNQVHGLDKEEAEFLDYVTERQQEVEKERELEELVVLQEFRNTVNSRSVPVESATSRLADKAPAAKMESKKRSSQAELLVGVVKRKRSDSNNSAEAKKRSTSTEQVTSSNDKPATSDQATAEADMTMAATAPTDKSPSTGNTADCSGSAEGTVGVARVIGVLPGLGVYTDSEQSDSSSSDSEIDTDIFRRDLQPKSGGQDSTTATTSRR